MKKLSALGALVVVSLVAAPAFAHEPDPSPAGANMLAYAAHDLTEATEALSQILASLGEENHVYQDAITLYDAAEHFEEEVLLGPEDLPVDFEAIEDTFDEMRNEFIASPCIQSNPAARSAWFQISEANLHLRIAWFTHSFLMQPPGPPIVPPPAVVPPFPAPHPCAL